MGMVLGQKFDDDALHIANIVTSTSPDLKIKIKK
jgi:hypothetical protein